MAFIAGPYTLTLGGSVLGIVEDAPSVEIVNEVDTIIGDNLGGSVQDGVYRGGNCFVDLVLQEFNAVGAASAFWPYAAFGTIGQVGRLLSALAAPLVFTVVAGTSATPASITFDKAILAPNFPVRILHGARLKNVPLRMQILPNSSAAWFS